MLREMDPCLKENRLFHGGWGLGHSLDRFHPKSPKYPFLLSLGSTGPNIYVTGILSSLGFAEHGESLSFSICPVVSLAPGSGDPCFLSTSLGTPSAQT